MKTGPLKSLCEVALTDAVQAQGLTRIRFAVYARSKDQNIWQGIWIAFNGRRGRLVVQPNVGVFLPDAERLVSDGLATIYDMYRRSPYWGKIRTPILSHPLYDLVRTRTGEDRLPSHYDVFAEGEAVTKAKLIADDFRHVGQHYFAKCSSTESLRDQLTIHWAPSGRVYAIAVTYLAQGGITAREIDDLLGQEPNEMSQAFAKYFKRKFAG